MIITTPTIEKIIDLRPHCHRLLTRCSYWSDSRVTQIIAEKDLMLYTGYSPEDCFLL